MSHPLIQPSVSPSVSPDRVESFLTRFSPCGLPSEREMVRLFLLQYSARHGSLPYGNHPLWIEDGGSGFLGRTVDFSTLWHD